MDSEVRALPLIRIEKLGKRYGRKSILRDLTLQVYPGEVVALMGANGAGKSTLIRLIAGLERADRGEIWLGRVALKRAGPEIRRYVGLVSHQSFLYENLSARENLRFYSVLYDLMGADERIETLLHQVDLWRRRDERVATYSRGMLQRLSLARALLHNPPVLLFDEPDTGLDSESLDMLGELIADLRRGGRALLVTTHDRGRGEVWGDRICLLRQGRVIENPTQGVNS